MSSQTRPKVHPADWTPERISSFWDNYASIPHFRNRYFSLSCGEGVLEFADKFVSKDGLYLDYGCGRGDLMKVLLRRGRRCMGMDSSIENVLTVNEAFAGQALFAGAYSSAARDGLPGAADTVTLVEVVEHMPRRFAPLFLRQVADRMKTGGRIVITCPNAENIVKAEVLCPECGCCFHPVQHMQSLTPGDVAALAEEAGFRTVHAGATRFRRVGESRFVGGLLAGWYSLIRKAPHLVYIGEKRAEG